MKSILTTLIILALTVEISLSQSCNQSNSPTSSVPNRCGITGNSDICLNGTKTYRISGGGSKYWNVIGPGLSIISGQGTNAVTVRGQQNATGKICVARYANGSEPCSECKTIRVRNTPNIMIKRTLVAPLKSGSISTVCKGGDVGFLAVINAPGTALHQRSLYEYYGDIIADIDWYDSNYPGFPLGNSISCDRLNIGDAQYTGLFYFRVRVTFTCGTSVTATINQQVSNCLGGGTGGGPGGGPCTACPIAPPVDNPLEIFPNPSNNNSIKVKTGKAVDNIRVIDTRSGTLVKTVETPVVNDGIIELRDLKKGSYIIELISNGAITKRRIIVE